MTVTSKLVRVAMGCYGLLWDELVVELGWKAP